MDVIVVKDYESLSTQACRMVSGQVQSKANSVLGLATGGTPEGMYQALIEEYAAGNLSFQETRTFNLDEYIGLPTDHSLSYHSYMYKQLFNHIDIPPENIHLPDGNASDLQAECKKYEAFIHEAGGIDLQILGLGHNGHIGFNEPETSFASRTHIIELDNETREANARFFEQKEDVPKRAITMGIETILSARKVLVLVSSADKAEAVKDMVCREITSAFPATVLQKHPAVTVLVDEKAALRLPQERITRYE
ncbi:glucosamine-6-phosphate deaminase [Geomicrobium halophilum]|uniref:Glucosamine-6-phosphate deaminase n=1 Tax=Geomicrobium halophilum TaxID=549000 RepID=A0A841Q0V4_9BACL|nr:glucosamine-6-phosphate deaminase [Geomicrobium halophilum]MBB6451362.1 glucosamine-6-phosphate deaminase [Geomicrobium halophilum]